MKRQIFIAVLLTVSLIFASCNIALSNKGENSLQTSQIITPQAEMRVAFTTETSDEELKANESVNYGFIIAKTTKDFDRLTWDKIGIKVENSFTLNDIDAVFWRLSTTRNNAKMINTLRSTKGVYYAEPELLSKIPSNENSTTYSELASRAISYAEAGLNDPFTLGAEYSLKITNSLEAYKAHPIENTDTIYTAVIDTGINRLNEDFFDESGNSIVEYAKSAFAKNTDTESDYEYVFVGDGNNYVDVPVNENWDDNAHGTHVAGTIAARGNNGKGVTGVAWKNVKIISYKCFCDGAESGSGSDWAVYHGLADLADWKKANPDKVKQATIPVNMSLGGNYAGSFELEMLNYAIKNGVLPIVAMGNDGTRIGQFPASYSGVLSVGATDGKDEKVLFSNTGHWISVSAPGFDIISTGNQSTNDYQWMSGTSMATPFVTGLVTYLLTQNKDLSPQQIKAIIEQTADDKGAAGFDEDFGFGRVNTKKAADLVAEIKAGTKPMPTTYSTKKITVAVENTNSNYHSGITNLDDRCPGQAIYLYNSDNQFVSMGYTNETDGTVDFNMLKPGAYTVKCNFYGELKTENVDLTNEADSELTLTFDACIYFISTVPATAYNGGEDQTDTIITLYKAVDDFSEEQIASYDNYALDTLQIKLDSGTYFAEITAYAGCYGNYGIQIGTESIATTAVTDGDRLATDDDSHEEDDNNDQARAKGVFTQNTAFAANILESDSTIDEVQKDVYMFIVP